MRKAVELRAKGFSLRAIAAHLGVDHTTVLADLRRHREGQRVVDLPGENPPPGGGNPPPKSTAGNVIPFNRKAS